MKDLDNIIDKESGFCETIRSMLGRNKLKYTVLNEMPLRKSYTDVHIDLTKILRYVCEKMMHAEMYESMYADYVYAVAGQILNIVAHYRHYFYIHKYNPKIYVYADAEYEKNEINDAVKMSKSVLKVIPGAYMIIVDSYDSVTPYIDHFSKKHSLVITKDPINFQLISENHSDIIFLNKDESLFYNKDHLYNVISEDRLKNDIVPIDLINVVLFFSGLGTNNSGVKGYGKIKTIKLISELISSGTISDTRYNSANDFCNDFKDYDDSIDLAKFMNNFNNYDLRMLKMSMSSAKKKIIDGYIIDKYSVSGLKELNSKYFFGLNSINLDYMMEYSDSNL